jgi:hypothetical protein
MTDPVDIYGPVIADLELRIAALQATLDSLRSLAGGGAPIAPASGNGSGLRVSGTAVSFSHDSFFNLTAAEAAKKYLAAIKKTASVNIISDVLLAGGWKTSSKNVPDLLRTILGRHVDFVRINGEFGLAEWYPGRKGDKKRQGTVVAASVEEEPDIEAMREAESENMSLLTSSVTSRPSPR